MRVVAVVQARTGSSRLSVKIFKRVGGQTIFTHVMARAKAISGVDLVHVTTTPDSRDDAVANRCRGAGVGWTRGQVPIGGGRNDVLAGFVEAAASTRADVVLRLTSDCALLDPEVAAKVLRKLTASPGLQYASNVDPPSWYDGCDVEAFTADALALADKHAGADEREHVTTWMRRHSPGACIRLIEAAGGYEVATGRTEYFEGSSYDDPRQGPFAWLKLSVDEPADLERVRRVWACLKNRARFGWADVVRAYYRAYPTPIITLARQIYGEEAKMSARVEAFCRGAAGSDKMEGQDSDAYYAGVRHYCEVPPHERERLQQLFMIGEPR